MNIPSYSKVYTFGDSAVQDVLRPCGDAPIVIQEKVDGSQLSFGVNDDGKLFVRSKKVNLDLDNAGMFRPVVDHLKTLTALLFPGWWYRGEYLRQPKHNALTYGRTPHGFVCLFDIQHDGGSLTSSIVETEAAHLGLDAVPSAEVNPRSITAEKLGELVKQESFLGGCEREGVVIKNYGRTDRHGKLLMAKYVGAAFREKHAPKSKVPRAPVSIVDDLVSQYAVEARYAKAIQHRRDEGLLEGDPTDIGPLIGEVQRDLLEEEGDAIKGALFKHFWKTIGRRVSAGMAGFYKDHLASQAVVGATA